MMELVTVKDGSCTVYVEKNLIKQVVIHPQIQQVPGAPDHICGIMLYERTPVVFCRLGDSGGQRDRMPGCNLPAWQLSHAHLPIQRP